MAKQIPTVGDQVVYIPHKNDEKLRNNNAPAIPGIVTQGFGGMLANMTVFPDQANPECLSSAPHKSENIDSDNGGYWMWRWEYDRDN